MNTTTGVQLYRPSSTDDLLLHAEQFGLSIPSQQRKLLQAEGVKPIREIPKAKLIPDVKAICRFSCRDMGIVREPDDYDQTRFFDIVTEYYGDLTVTELKQAFEFYALGFLDNYLPKDREGNALQHFQQFSISFIRKVLDAYKQKRHDAKQSVTGKVQLLLAQKNEEERDPYDDRVTLLDCLKGLVMEIADGGSPVMSLVASSEWALQKLKLLPAEISPSDADLATARMKITRGLDSAVEQSIANALKNGIVPEDLASRARGICIRRILKANALELGPAKVAERFDWLIGVTRKRQKKEAVA